MSRNDDDLLGMFALLDVADYIRTFDVRQSLRREEQFHFDRPFLCKIDNQVGVFARDRARRNFRRVIGVFSLPSVRQTIIRAANRSNQTRSRALSRRRAWSIASIKNCFAVSFA